MHTEPSSLSRIVKGRNLNLKNLALLTKWSDMKKPSSAALGENLKQWAVTQFWGPSAFSFSVMFSPHNTTFQMTMHWSLSRGTHSRFIMKPERRTSVVQLRGSKARTLQLGDDHLIPAELVSLLISKEMNHP